MKKTRKKLRGYHLSIVIMKGMSAEDKFIMIMIISLYKWHNVMNIMFRKITLLWGICTHVCIYMYIDTKNKQNISSIIIVHIKGCKNINSQIQFAILATSKWSDVHPRSIKLYYNNITLKSITVTLSRFSIL